MGEMRDVEESLTKLLSVVDTSDWPCSIVAEDVIVGNSDIVARQSKARQTRSPWALAAPDAANAVLPGTLGLRVLVARQDGCGSLSGCEPLSVVAICGPLRSCVCRQVLHGTDATPPAAATASCHR